MKATKSRIITARLGLARLLWRAGMDKIGAAVFPKLQGGVTWAGSWLLGAGYTLSVGTTWVFSDPKYIQVSETSVFHKMLVTLGGAQRLFGKRNNFPIIKLAVADSDATANLCVDPPVSATISLIPPTGTTRTATGRIVSDEYGQIEPEGEFMRIVTIACSTVLA